MLWWKFSVCVKVLRKASTLLLFAFLARIKKVHSELPSIFINQSVSVQSVCFVLLLSCFQILYVYGR